MRSTAKRTAILGVLAALTAGCSLNSSALSTGSLFGASKPKAPTPETSQDRLLQVATTSARAQRCGYVFDPNGVRTQYLAAEAAQGNNPDQLARIEKSYDFTFAKVAKDAAGDEGYCDDAKTAVIKRDLGKVLAGDFSSPASIVKPDIGIGWGKGPDEKLDREKLFNPDPRR